MLSKLLCIFHLVPISFSLFKIGGSFYYEGFFTDILFLFTTTNLRVDNESLLGNKSDILPVVKGRNPFPASRIQFELSTWTSKGFSF